MSLPNPFQSRSILVFRMGQLGDTIVGLPALWAARSFFDRAQFTLLSDRHPGKGYAAGADLLRGTGIFDAFEDYPVDDSVSGRFWKPLKMVQLLARLRRKRFDTLLYLVPSIRSLQQVERDRRFFRAAGIPVMLGLEGFPPPRPEGTSGPESGTTHEADHLLARLALSGVPVPAAGQGSMDLGLGETEEREVDAWLSRLLPSGDRPWIAFGPGSKMPSKRWPLDRFYEVGAALIDRFDIWPVVLGGPEDRDQGSELLRRWRRGYNAAGALGLRGSAAALRRCQLYIGNDTGTMHLAAAAGVRCAALFSARDQPGKWNPYGPFHRVFRSTIECQGCGLLECRERHNECLERISVAEVVAACGELLRDKFGIQWAAASSSTLKAV